MGAEPETEPAELFMAGLPGSGKMEISRYLIRDPGVKLFRIDMDEIAEIEMCPPKVLLDVLNGFYPLEKHNEMGVVGIRVEVMF